MATDFFSKALTFVKEMAASTAVRALKNGDIDYNEFSEKYENLVRESKTNKLIKGNDDDMESIYEQVEYEMEQLRDKYSNEDY